MGFWAFGVGVSENVLMAFEHSAHKWVVAMANIMVVVHVAAAYQVRGGAFLDK
jgi:cytochrome b561